MEDTLGVTRARLIFTFNAVLILVLMEDTLGGVMLACFSTRV